MAAHTHLPTLSLSRVLFDPYQRRFRHRNGLQTTFSKNEWWLFLSHECHVYVGHEPGLFVAEPWVTLMIPLGETGRPARWWMTKCLELAHAFVEP